MVFHKRMRPNRIEIWAPKYSTNQVLIAVHKLRGDNEIVFTKAPKWPGTYYVSGKTAQASPVVSNGAIKCYAVDLDKLELLDEEQV